MRPATPLICEFITAHRERFGVAPICRALSAHGVKIAPRTYARSNSPVLQRPVEPAQFASQNWEGGFQLDSGPGLLFGVAEMEVADFDGSEVCYSENPTANAYIS